MRLSDVSRNKTPNSVRKPDLLLSFVMSMPNLTADTINVENNISGFNPQFYAKEKRCTYDRAGRPNM